jgi:hypothetical protein
MKVRHFAIGNMEASSDMTYVPNPNPSPEGEGL